MREAGRRATATGVAPVVLVAVAVVSAAAVGVLGVTGRGSAMSVGALTCGALAVGCGVLLLVRGAVGQGAAPFRLWSGAALLAWGVGQVLQGFLVLSTHAAVFPTPGDITSLLAAPLAGAAVMTLPRTGSAGSCGRLLVDATLLATTAALLVWRFGFVDVLAADGELLIDPAGWFAVLVLVADLMILALVFLAGVRDLDRDLLLVAAGVAFHAAGDLFTLYEILRANTWPWVGTLLWCLAWPLIAAGLIRYDPRPATLPDDAAEPESRVVLVSTVGAVGLLAAGVLAVIVTGRSDPDPVSLWFVLVALVVLGARETLNTGHRGRLLARLRDEATTDPLTGLANRRVLVSRLAAVPCVEPWSLLTVDLDGFKEVNALLGHPTGDRLLVAAARRIVETAPADALVCRLGGDEFGVLVAGDLPHAEQVGEHLVTAVRRSTADVPRVDRVGVSASVGVAAVSGPRAVTDGDDPLAALSAAGAALRAAKAAGRDRVEVYDDAIARDRRRRLSVEDRLRQAIAAGAVGVAFQPIVDLTRRELCGAEALARWTDDELGVVDPGEFIPVAEETGLVVALGEAVLDRTLAAAAGYDFAGRGLRVSCNVSPVQLRVPGFHKVVTEALAAHRVPSGVLIVEITEEVLVEENGPAAQTLRRLADAGVTIAIDDFGTGYSALGYLRRLPAHVLKVDRSLTGALAREPQARAIVRAVVDLGRSIGLSVVVEGVETPQTADLVAGLGASFGQGALFGDAVSAADLVASAWRRSA